MKVSDDLREYVESLESQGELRRVKAEVDWNLEIGAITRRLIDTKGPAPLFENIKGYARGKRILGLPFGPSNPLHARLALSLGMKRSTPPREIINEVQNRLNVSVKPKIVSDAPCKENIARGDNVNLLDFPAPYVHSVDGGRYIGTWCIVVTKDDEGGWQNWGVYRVMVQNEKVVSINYEMKARQHGGDIFERDEAKHGELSSSPIAIVLGAGPISLLAAAMSPPAGTSEANVASSLMGDQLELVKCESVDLEVPASSEIVIEGEVPFGKRMKEGPMGEFSGYTAGGKMDLPYVEIKCITWRNDPIITLANMGKPWDDCATVYTVSYSAWIRKILQEKGLPVKDVYVWPVYGTVISVTQDHGPMIAERIMNALKETNCRTGLVYTFIVNDDIDVTSLEDVFWCFTTRCHPKNGIHVQERKGGSPLIPYRTPEERAKNYSYGAYFDCTWPTEWPKEYLAEHCQVVDFANAWPAEIQQRVLNRWKEYDLNGLKSVS